MMISFSQEYVSKFFVQLQKLKNVHVELDKLVQAENLVTVLD
jgi:hypothetical protein